jgi:DTW domain-containing protein YfiP
MRSTPTRRASCPACVRARSACICAWVRPVEAAPALLILQHPLEVANAKNSARLLHLCVQESVLAIGEAFEEAALDALLHADGRTPVLLYPATPGFPAPACDLPPAVELRLVVLDATWRKSRKMLHLNPALQALPRLALSDMPASRYRIRKAHAPDQLSTLEASAWALGQLSEDPTRLAPLLEAFDGFVEQLAAYVPCADARDASHK